MKAFLVFVFCLVCCWSTSFAQFNPNCYGNRRTLVHLFEWRWDDIAQECERFLAPKGFCGVQVSPPNENRIVMNSGVQRPWYERYQPVSYTIYSRSGNESAFINMVSRCNNVGVRVYVDAVINHMAAVDCSCPDTGIAGTPFSNVPMNFPGVPYNSTNFHQTGSDCPTSSGNIENYSDATQVRNCRLVGLLDLNLSEEDVRGKIVAYLNKLIGYGVAGFRIDAAKHMWPADLQVIYSRLNTLSTTWFSLGTTPFIFQEVIDYGGEAIKSSDYNGMARVIEFNYGKYLSQAFSGNNLLTYYKSFGAGWGYLMSDSAALVFIDNHDTQRDNGAILNFFSSRQYKMAVTFMLSWPYGIAQIMSSYSWNRNFQNGVDLNSWIGPPSDSNYNTKTVTINSDQTCGNGWVCEHRWRQITNMVHFRNVAGTDPVANWWDDGNYQVTFSRGNKAFYAVNAGNNNMAVIVQTGMAPGRYCDVISGDLSTDGKSCTGKIIVVNSDGTAQIVISNTDSDPIIAIHNESKLTPSYQRTIVFIQYTSNYGDNLFLRGGVSYGRRSQCNSMPAACTLPINYTNSYYAAYNTWATGDTYLDWSGVQTGQWWYQSVAPAGSPMAWTTNSPTTDANYSPLNSYGSNYWLWDVQMDCSATDNGWFEVKGFLNGNWEANIYQTSSCSGTSSSSTPFSSTNHIARCGYKNVFYWGSNSCLIDNLS